MTITSSIPKNLKEELAIDPFMKKCCLFSLGDCNGRVEFHHNYIYASFRQNKKFCILPVCQKHHREESKWKRYLNSIMLNRMNSQDFLDYPRTNWKVMKETCIPLP